LYIKALKFIQIIVKMNKWPVFVVLFLSCIVFSESAPSLEYDFEYGLTNTLTEVTPSTNIIKFVKNENVDKWPIRGGTGIIDPHHPENSEFFTYQKRESNRLIGIKGIRNNHTSLSEMTNCNLEGWNVADTHITFVKDNPIRGNFSIRIPFDTAKGQIILYKTFSPVPEIWGRFHVRLDASAIENIQTGQAWIFEVPTRLRIGMDKKTKTFVLRIHTGPSIQEKKDVYLHDTETIQPDRTYCLEYHFIGRERGGAEFWVDGRPAGSRLDNDMRGWQNAAGLTFGSFSWAKFYTGHMVLDDIVTANERPGPVSDTIGNIEKYFFTDKAHLKILPVESMTHWQYIGNRFDIRSILNLALLQEAPKQFRLQDLPAGPGWIRVRTQNRWHNWGPWSGFTALPHADTAGSMGGPAAVSASRIILDPHAYHEDFAVVVPEKWFDIRIINDQIPYLPAKSRLCLHLHHYSDLHSSLSTYLERVGSEGIVFSEKSSYGFIFYLDSKFIYAAFKEGFKKTYEVHNKTFDYIDGLKSAITHRGGRPAVQARIRLSPKARQGLWFADGFVQTVSEMVPVQRSVFLVTKTEDLPAAKPAFPLKAVIPVLSIFLILIFIYYKKRSTADKGDPFIRQVNEYILANLDNSRLSLEDVARSMNRSRTSFSNLFNKKLKMTFPQYLGKVRIDEASRLLKTTPMQVSEVAFKVGFDSVSYFNKVFKGRTGRTPGEFREKQGQG
jgi:AraC-like DNA-binding protein